MASSEYGKIIVGEPIDESATPLIATGYSTDPETAQAVPMYYRSGAAGPTSDAYQVGYEQSQPPNVTIYERDPREDCAQIGCLLSWIPIIGIITCCVNMDAPSDSPRAYWSRIAFAVSCVVIMLNIVYFMTY